MNFKLRLFNIEIKLKRLNIKIMGLRIVRRLNVWYILKLAVTIKSKANSVV